LLHQLPLGADRVERLQQQRPQQTLRRNRGTPVLGVEPGELAIQRGKHLVDDQADQPQRMVLRHALFNIDIREQLARPLVRTAHRCLPPASLGKSRIRFAEPCHGAMQGFSAAC
jgi:hypothetical protein